MAQATFKFNQKEWKGKVQKTLHNLRNKRRILQSAFLTHGFTDVRNHFRQEKGPNGKWPRRASSTSARDRAISTGKRKVPKNTRKAWYKPGRNLLMWSGGMSKSFLKTNIKPHGRDGLLFFNSKRYSGAHDTGAPARNIPKREFMWLSKRAKVLMAKQIAFLVNR